MKCEKRTFLAISYSVKLDSLDTEYESKMRRKYVHQDVLLCLLYMVPNTFFSYCSNPITVLVNMLDIQLHYHIMGSP